MRRPCLLRTLPILCFAGVSHAQAESLSLERAMSRAAEKAHSPRILAAAMREAEARAEQSARLAGPRLDLDATVAGVSTKANKLVGESVGGQTVPDSIQTTSLTLSQPIIALGPLFLRNRSDRLAAEAAAQETGQAIRYAKYAGGEAFLRAKKAEELLKISEASISVAQKQRADGAALAKVGKMKTADLLRLDMAVSEARTQRALAASVRDVAFFSLGEILQIADWRDIQLEGASGFSSDKGSPFADESEAIATAEKSRTEISAQRTRVRTAELGLQAQRFDLLPQLNAFAKWDHDFAKGDVTTPPFHLHNPRNGAVARSFPSETFEKSNINDNLTYGLSLRWNLWDWGARNARENESVEKIVALKESLAQIEQNIRIEAMQAQRDFRASQEALASADSTLTFAEELYRQTNARFQVGMATAAELVTAERDQTRARAGLSNAQSDLEISLLKLKKATGNGNF